MLKSVNVSTSLYDLKRIFTRGNITVHILHLFSKMYGRYSVFIRLSLYCIFEPVLERLRCTESRLQFLWSYTSYWPGFAVI